MPQIQSFINHCLESKPECIAFQHFWSTWPQKRPMLIFHDISTAGHQWFSLVYGRHRLNTINNTNDFGISYLRLSICHLKMRTIKTAQLSTWYIIDSQIRLLSNLFNKHKLKNAYVWMLKIVIERVRLGHYVCVNNWC